MSRWTGSIFPPVILALSWNAQADDMRWAEFERVSAAGLAQVPEFHHDRYFLTWVEGAVDPANVRELAMLYGGGFAQPTYLAVGGPDARDNLVWLTRLVEFLGTDSPANLHLVVVDAAGEYDRIAEILHPSSLPWTFAPLDD